MQEHLNVDRARRAWQAVACGDREPLRELWDEKVVWHVNSRLGPFAGDWRGLDAVFDLLAGIGEFLEAFDARLVDVLASEDHAVIVFRANVVRGEQRAEIEYILLSRIEGGKTVEIWTTPLDQSAAELIWGSPGDPELTPAA